MDLAHWMIWGIPIAFVVGGLLGGGIMYLIRIVTRDEAIDAMIFLAQREAFRELRERFEQMRPPAR